MDTNTLWCWSEKDEHGTTALPSTGYQIGWSQNLSKKTVTVAAKWKQGLETAKSKQIRLQQLEKTPKIYKAFQEAEKKNINEQVDKEKNTDDESSNGSESENSETGSIFDVKNSKHVKYQYKKWNWK
jgi:hypothetical protein